MATHTGSGDMENQPWCVWFYCLTVLQIILTADQFQKLSKAYSILTDPAAKVADIAQLLHKIIVHVLVIAGCIRQVAEGQACCKEEAWGAERQEEETQRE